MAENLVLFAFYYKPENTSGVQRAARLAKYLPENGLQTWVIASSSGGTDPTLERVVHVPNPGTELAHVQRRSRWAERLEVLLPYQERLPWAPHALEAFERIHERNPVSAVISTSPPTGGHAVAWMIKRKYGIRWIADFRDPILGNPGRPRRWAQPYDRFLQREIFRSADLVLTVTDTMRDMWRKEFPRWSHKFKLVWNGFDPDEGFGPKPIPERPHRVLTHAGVLYSLRHPYHVMAGIERLIRGGILSAAKLRLRFVGIVQEMERFRDAPAVAYLDAQGCVEMNGVNVPRQQAMDEIATADYLFLIDIVNTENAGYTVPAKLYDYLLTGRPILSVTDPGSPVDRILAQSGVPYACLYHSDPPETIDAKLGAFFRLSSEPVKPSPWFYDNFDGRRQAALISEMLKPAAGG